MISDCFRGGADRYHFRVRGWIIIGERAIVRARDYFSFVYEDRADGNFVAFRCGTGFFQRGAHEL
jgi:hypothetical protein